MPTKAPKALAKVLADRRDMLVFNLSFQKTMLLLSEVT
jgi:hypothetical protein